MVYRQINAEVEALALRLLAAGRINKKELINLKIMSRATLYRRLADQRRSRHTPGRHRLISPAGVKVLLGIVERRPDIYLDELQAYLREAEGVTVSLSTVHRILERAGMSWKKAHRIARERSKIKRNEFRARIVQYSPEQLVFADETAYDARDGARLHGRSLRNTLAPVPRPYIRGTRLSCIAGLTQQGIIAPWAVQGAFNRETFRTYLLLELLPLMRPFPQHNSVLVLDNASIHHAQEIRSLVEDDFGCRIEFLPPYSPDYNPIERAFSKIKSTFRRQQAVHAKAEDFYAATRTITREDCIAWTRLAGYPF